MTTADFLSLALMALLGSGHCIGMCGVFAISAAGKGGAVAILRRQFGYQIGKTLAYVFIALVLVLALRWASRLSDAQTVFSVFVGCILIALGVFYAFEMRLPGRIGTWVQGAPICRVIATALSAPVWWRSVLIGWVSGFLPCGLSFAALSYAASFASVVDAAIGAAVFGFSTMPGLLLAAFLSGKISIEHRRWLVRLAGVSLIFFGALTLVRSSETVHGWLHRWLMPS